MGLKVRGSGSSTRRHRALFGARQRESPRIKSELQGRGSIIAEEMESSQVYCIVLCLLAFTQAVVLQVADSGVASDNDAVTKDTGTSPAVQYLQQLFQTFKESNRFRNGEMNLLPDETKGFATRVHCFQAQNNNLPQGTKHYSYLSEIN